MKTAIEILEAIKHSKANAKKWGENIWDHNIQLILNWVLSDKRKTLDETYDEDYSTRPDLTKTITDDPDLKQSALDFFMGALVGGAFANGVFLWWCVIHIKALEKRRVVWTYSHSDTPNSEVK